MIEEITQTEYRQLVILDPPISLSPQDKWNSLKHYVSSQSFSFFSDTHVTREKGKQKEAELFLLHCLILVVCCQCHILCTHTQFISCTCWSVMFISYSIMYFVLISYYFIRCMRLVFLDFHSYEFHVVILIYPVLSLALV